MGPSQFEKAHVVEELRRSARRDGKRNLEQTFAETRRYRQDAPRTCSFLTLLSWRGTILPESLVRAIILNSPMAALPAGDVPEIGAAKDYMRGAKADNGGL